MSNDESKNPFGWIVLGMIIGFFAGTFVGITVRDILLNNSPEAVQEACFKVDNASDNIETCFKVDNASIKEIHDNIMLKGFYIYEGDFYCAPFDTTAHELTHANVRHNFTHFCSEEKEVIEYINGKGC